MFERLPNKIEKISRAETQQLEQEKGFELDKITNIDPDDVWGHDIAKSFQTEENINSLAAEGNADQAIIESMRAHALKKRTEAIHAAKTQVENLAKYGFGSNLTTLTNEIIRDAELLKRVISENPTIHEVVKRHKTESALSIFNRIIDLSSGPNTALELSAIRFWRQTQLSDETWGAIAIKHSEEFEKTAKLFKEELGREAVRDVYNLQFRAVRRGILPISRERFMHTMGKTVITLADTMDRGLEKIGGIYNQSKNKIALSSALIQPDTFDFEYLKKVLTHEYIHALDGRTAVKSWTRMIYTEDDIDETQEDDASYKEEMMGISISNVGLLRQGLFFTGQQEDRFNWLNEAVTEMIVDEIIPDAPYPTYPEFREAVQYLMNEGSQKIPFDMLKNAFFEDFNPDDKQTIPHWKKLRRAINEAHGHRFLIAFDDLIKADGVEAAIAKAAAGELR